ncbi:NAD(P)H-hydrate epimerase [Microbacterium xanthum]|uniref:NAD(P)H-hydrate epimerase n=1 Tax=Microbacterium xanthum TaxID=3079794 RepID=UPI002AD40387|nr:NAD(P)H-hydrate epimerase [Microbacterium sp. KSW-48]MDZ8172488.1 NAD(P)H-hydrate epimerase [Microbacterium sp. KSW-48]
MTCTAPAYTADQVRAAEKPLLEAGEPLMRWAASALARVIADELVGRPHPRVLVLAGRGDNGADALYAAQRLVESGMDVDTLLTSGDAHVAALAAAMSAGVRRIEADGLDATAYDLVVDGIVGLGARGPLRGAARATVSAMRGADIPPVVAVDLPSGLHPDEGSADDAVLPAAVTVTFGAVKRGVGVAAGPGVVGRIVLVDLGLDLPDGLDLVEVERVVDGRAAQRE